MTDEQWATVWEVFNSAQTMPAGERSRLLRSAGLDSGMLEEVRALLELSGRYVSADGPSSAVAPRQELPRFAAGEELGRYIIISLIGEGGFGRVYAARDKQLRRDVAIKVLNQSSTESAGKVLEEARAASALNHPNILTVHETLLEGSYVAIVMELVDGPSLRQVLAEAKGRLPLEHTLRAGRQIAEALREAHGVHIVHRDVKPENVLLRRKDGYLKLVDFGLASGLNSRGNAADHGEFAGTMRYLAPEQIAGEPATAASDVFALGLVLYEMAAGVHPFGRHSPIDSALAIASVEPVPPIRHVRTLPRDLNRLIVESLHKNPGLRPAAAEVVRRLEKIQDGLATRRLPRLPLLIAGVLVCALLFFGWQRFPRPVKLQLRMQARLLSGQPGRESAAAISPDGKYAVYSWQKRESDATVTVVREIETERVTNLDIPGPYAWLPDGQHIGFLRRGAEADRLCTVKLDGSEEAIILEARQIGQFAWSPDGKFIVYAAPIRDTRQGAIYRYTTDTRETAQITFPGKGSTGDQDLAISPDSRMLAFRRTIALATSDVYVVDLRQPVTPRQITFQRSEGQAIAWTPDASAIITSVMEGAHFSLWLQELKSPGQPSRLTEVGLEAFSVGSAVGRNRLIWTNTSMTPTSGVLRSPGVRPNVCSARRRGSATSPGPRKVCLPTVVIVQAIPKYGLRVKMARTNGS